MGFETSSGTLEKSVDAAIAHAEIHWKKLMSEKTLRLAEKYDNVLYDAFRSFFPDVSVGKIKRVTFDGTCAICQPYKIPRLRQYQEMMGNCQNSEKSRKLNKDYEVMGVGRSQEECMDQCDKR